MNLVKGRNCVTCMAILHLMPWTLLKHKTKIWSYFYNYLNLPAVYKKCFANILALLKTLFSTKLYRINFSVCLHRAYVFVQPNLSLTYFTGCILCWKYFFTYENWFVWRRIRSLFTNIGNYIEYLQFNW